VFGKKKKAWFVKKIALKNQVLGRKLKASFSKYDFVKKHDKKMSYQTDTIHCLLFSFVGWNFCYVPRHFNFVACIGLLLVMPTHLLCYHLSF
jgi:hypothetical protein